MSLDEALDQVLGQAQVIAQTERVAILDADSRFLAEDLISELQVPPQDNSSMDGYAMREQDVQTLPAELSVLGVSAPGAAWDGTLAPGVSVIDPSA